MRPADSYSAVGESLQADVMRFMAIIAFCLIAILALVRGVEPPADSKSAAVASPQPQPQPASAAEAAPAAAEKPPVEPADPQPVEPSPQQQAAARPVPAEPAEPEPVPTPPSQTEKEGLSLRFASDRDFLRLVSRGDIRVFAFNEAEVLSLDGDFRFQPATSPGRVHELLAETIPELVVGALRRHAAPEAYNWGIAMPDRLARQIRGYVDGGATGELVINRFGEVRHHEV
ncbi:MAG: hypothetical protein U5Q16_01680 [Gammaproteobacteria bacterium]|nr:hypothetical protein [Gammaproteobacteria bacterium]